MIHTLEGKLNGAGRRLALIVSRFNSLVSERLLEGAVDCLLRHGAAETDLTILRVPGAWEIPLAAQRAAASARFQAVICLGAIIRGETPHFDYIAAELSKGIASVGLQAGVPVAFGVLTTDTLEQALERAGAKAGNKGWDAALSALEMIDLLAQLA